MNRVCETWPSFFGAGVILSEIPMLLKLLALVPMFSLLNRGAGMDEWFPGRNIYGVVLIVGAVSWLFFGWQLAAALALSWIFYRIPGWYALLDMGRNNAGFWDDPTKTTLKDFLLMIPRQMFYFPIFAYAWYFEGVDPILAGILWVITGILGALGYLAGHLAWLKTIKSPAEPLSGVNPGLVAELAAGAGLGIGTAAILSQFLL